MVDVISGTLHIAGAALVLLAGVGVLRFPDLYSRMHAATKAATLGFLLVAVGTAIELEGNLAKLVLAVLLVFITAPVAAHLLGRSAYRADRIDVPIDTRDDLEEYASGDHEV